MGSLIGDLINITDDNRRAINRKIRKLQKKHPELVPTYTKFGKESIVLSIVTFAFFVFSPLLMYICINYALQDLGTATYALALGNIILFCLAIVCAFIPIMLASNGLQNANAQLQINDMPIGKKAKRLAVWTFVLSIFATIALVIFGILVLMSFVD